MGRSIVSLWARIGSLLLAGTATTAAGEAAAQSDDSAVAWSEAKQMGTVEAYERYLERFPTSRFSDDAFLAIIGATSGQTAPNPLDVQIDMY